MSSVLFFSAASVTSANRADGKSEREGKAANVAASELGKGASFNPLFLSFCSFRVTRRGILRSTSLKGTEMTS